jgi:hypothetical protein
MLNGYLQLSGGNGMHVAVRDVYAQGRITPLLRLNTEFETGEGRKAELLHVAAMLSCRDEHLGRGEIFGGHVGSTGYQTLFEIPTTPRLIEHVTTVLGTSGTIELHVRWSGRVRFGLDANATRSVAHEPEPGQSSETTIQGGTPTPVQISRSDWYERVLAPIRSEDYVYLEVSVPRGAASTSWRAALQHFTQAEKALVLGDDAAVFVHLRGVMDALPGAKANIFDALPEPKRKRVDAIAREVGQFLHLGRHVAASGADAGSFPVDHVDAEYAIAQMKVLISYASRLLARGAAVR